MAEKSLFADILASLSPYYTAPPEQRDSVIQKALAPPGGLPPGVAPVDVASLLRDAGKGTAQLTSNLGQDILASLEALKAGGQNLVSAVSGTGPGSPMFGPFTGLKLFGLLGEGNPEAAAATPTPVPEEAPVPVPPQFRMGQVTDPGLAALFASSQPDVPSVPDIAGLDISSKLLEAVKSAGGLSITAPDFGRVESELARGRGEPLAAVSPEERITELLSAAAGGSSQGRTVADVLTGAAGGAGGAQRGIRQEQRQINIYNQELASKYHNARAQLELSKVQIGQETAAATAKAQNDLVKTQLDMVKTLAPKINSVQGGFTVHNPEDGTVKFYPTGSEDAALKRMELMLKVSKAKKEEGLVEMFPPGTDPMKVAEGSNMWLAINAVNTLPKFRKYIEAVAKQKILRDGGGGKLTDPGLLAKDPLQMTPEELSKLDSASSQALLALRTDDKDAQAILGQTTIWSALAFIQEDQRNLTAIAQQLGLVPKTAAQPK